MSPAITASLQEHLDTLAQAVIVTDREGHVTYWNDGAASLYGWSSEEALGRPITELTPSAASRTLAASILERLSRGELWIGEFPVRARDGREFNAWVIDAPIMNGGQIDGILGLSVPAELVDEAVRTAHNRHRAVLVAAPDPIFHIDREGRFIDYTGPAGQRLWTSPSDFLGKRMDEVLPPDVAALSMAAVARVLAGEPVVTIEYELELPHGRRAFETRLSASSTREVVAIVRDVTESRRFQEELHERVAERTEEIAALSRRLLAAQEDERRRIGRELHDEVGQSLTAVATILGAARRTPGDAEARLDEAERIIGALVEQVRDLSFDLAPLGDDLADALRIHAAAFSSRVGLPIVVTSELAARRPPEVEAAAFRIVQEALTNVARHARATNAAVTLTDGGGELRVAVPDDGIGFDAARDSGTGLDGLRERARLAGGLLSIDSAPERGTRVTAVFRERASA